MDDRSGSVQRRRQAVRIHAGVWIQPNVSFGRRSRKYPLHEFRIMNPAELFASRQGRIVMQ